MKIDGDKEMKTNSPGFLIEIFKIEKLDVSHHSVCNWVKFSNKFVVVVFHFVYRQEALSKCSEKTF